MSSENWERFFEDLEYQFAAERESAAQAQESESERVRVARTTMRDRIGGIRPGSRIVVYDVSGGVHRLSIEAVGADWMAGADDDASGIVLLPLDAIEGVRFSDARDDRGADEDPLLARMDFGFALRALARRRAAIRVGSVRGDRIAGTPSLVGADHVDLAIHDAGATPRAGDVRGIRMIPFRAIAWIRTTSRRDLGGVYGRV